MSRIGLPFRLRFLGSRILIQWLGAVLPRIGSGPQSARTLCHVSHCLVLTLPSPLKSCPHDDMFGVRRKATRLRCGSYAAPVRRCDAAFGWASDVGGVSRRTAPIMVEFLAIFRLGFAPPPDRLLSGSCFLDEVEEAGISGGVI